MSEDTPCFQNPQPECLSEISEHIDPAITDHVFSMRGNYSEDFECLYKSWWDVQDKFGDHLPRRLSLKCIIQPMRSLISALLDNLFDTCGICRTALVKMAISKLLRLLRFGVLALLMLVLRRSFSRGTDSLDSFSILSNWQKKSTCISD